MLVWEASHNLWLAATCVAPGLGIVPSTRKVVNSWLQDKEISTKVIEIKREN